METLLAYQNAIEQLQFVKAAAILRCSLKPELRTSMSFLFAPLLMFTTCESIYYDMPYLTFKQTPDTDNQLQLLYSEVLADLNQVSAVLDTVVANYVPQSNPQQKEKELIQAKFLSRFIYHLRIVIVIRRKMIEIYNELQIRKVKISYAKLIETFYKIKAQLERDVDHHLMAQFRDNIISEIEIMLKLLSTQRYLSLFKIKETLFSLYQCRCEFETLEHKFMCLGDDMADPLQYTLFQYHRAYFTSLAAKSHFFFQKGIYTDGLNMTNIKPTLDYHGIVVNYHLQSKFKHFFMLLRVYRHPPFDSESLPLIYNYPEGTETTACWDKTFDLIKQQKQYINKYKNPPYYYYSNSSDLTYFIVRVDVLVYMCIIYPGKKSDTDSEHRSFIEFLTENLRNCTLSLK